MAARKWFAIILSVVTSSALPACRHDGSAITDAGYGVDAAFQNMYPAAVHPGETVTMHVAAKVVSVPGGPFHAYLEVFADKNLEFRSASATSASRGPITLNGTDYEAFDQTAIGFYAGPLNAGDVVFADLIYRVKDEPSSYSEPSGFPSVHMGTELFPDPNLPEGYTHGVGTDAYIPLTSD